MATSHISEAEIVTNPAALLSRVRAGQEVIVESNGVAIAHVKAPERKGRPISELIALAEAHAKERGYDVFMDQDFKTDMEEIIRNRKPRDTSQWD